MSGRSLGEAYLAEQSRLRTCLRHAAEMGPAGGYLCGLIEALLRRADRAVMERDIWEMSRILDEMKEIVE